VNTSEFRYFAVLQQCHETDAAINSNDQLYKSFCK